MRHAEYWYISLKKQMSEVEASQWTMNGLLNRTWMLLIISSQRDDTKGKLTHALTSILKKSEPVYARENYSNFTKRQVKFALR